jgi:uncharacterized protein (DUF2141 family)
MKLTRVIVVTGLIAGLTSCATMNAPEGGPRDLTAPILLESSPKDQELNVKTKTIRLVFDEEVQQNSLIKELLITPNVNNKYEVKPNRNVMTLEFEKPLQDSTTFTFNFRKGITDITEKNAAEGLRLSFSTGSFIDSSRVSGTVIHLLKQTPEKEAVIALYQAEDTLTIRKNRPYYLTTTDANGNFSIENVKEGNYRMYAVLDKNNNSYYDNEEERIAYLTAPIQITPTTDSVMLHTIRLDTKKPILLQRERFTDRFIANYNEGIQQFMARAGAGATDTLIHKVGPEGKAVELFKTAAYGGGQTILSAVDSSGNIAIDTIQIVFEGKRAQLIRGAQLKVMNNGAKSNYRVGQPVTLALETPVSIKGNAPISLLADSVVLHELTYPEQLTLDKTAIEITFTLPTIINRIKQVSVVLDSTAIVPLQGEPLTFRPIDLTIAEARGTGSLSGNIKTANTSYIIQLINNEYKVIAERRNGSKYEFKNIEPGTYRIRVLIDENNNGKWDKGDPEFKTAPEKVYIYPKTFDVRADWMITEENMEF